MLNQQRINAVEYELDVIDQDNAEREQVGAGVELFAAGYMIDVDRRLDDRHAQQLRRDRLQRGEVPNG